MPETDTLQRVPELSTEQLKENAARYPEMAWDLTIEEIDNARHMLMRIPLVHRTSHQRFSGDKPEEQTLYDTPVSSDTLSGSEPSSEDNTHAADHQLGLDNYVFLGWGGILSDERRPFIGDADYAVLVSPTILEQPGTVVTPSDLALHIDSDALYDGLDKEDLSDVQEYLGTAVSGSDWIEIASRRLAKVLREGKSFELSLEELGEIKVKNEVPRSYIIAGMDVRSYEYEQYARHINEISRGQLRLRAAGMFARLFHRISGWR